MADYVLGVDLGTTFSAAAVHRGAYPEPVTLGATSYTVPSVVYFAEDDSVLVGEAAADAARHDPSRAVAEFKRRIGDETPIVCGPRSEPAVWYMGQLLRWIVERVTAREGGRPARTTLTHPANWGPYKQSLLGDVVVTAGLDPTQVSTITEPAAAAIRYANLRRVEIGDAVAIYDFGGGTFDAAVLRVHADGFEILGEPAGIERLGGVDIDWVVYAMVNEAVGGRLDRIDRADRALGPDLAALAEACTRAKIALSSHPRAQVRARVGNELIDVVLQRTDFNRHLRAKIDQTISSLQQAVRSAGLVPADLGRILLAGGSSQIPLVASAVREAFGVDVTVDVDPTNAVATGAALHAHFEHTGQNWTPPPPGAGEPAGGADQTGQSLGVDAGGDDGGGAGAGAGGGADTGDGGGEPEPGTAPPVAPPGTPPAVAPPGTPPAAAAGPALSVRWDDGELLASTAEVVTVGRSPDRSIVLGVDVVSRRHGEFRHEGDGWVYEDQRSSNHSFVEGREITRFEIRGPVRIGLGRTGPVLEVDLVPTAG